MRVMLFIPCLVEDCLPEIGEAMVAVLDHLGIDPVLPPGQTCCGQLAYKTGDLAGARTLARRYLEIFSGTDAVVCPAGSCVKMLRAYPALFEGQPELQARAADLAARTFEFCEFVHALPNMAILSGRLSVRACYHDSCQMGRGLGLVEAPRRLLRAISGLELVEAAKAERCCGFGGVFSLQFTGVSEALADDKAREILATGAQLLVSAEPSCLMNLSGTLARLGRALPALHVAQVLAQALRLGGRTWF